MPKGIKTCQSCKKSCGARASTCPHCKTPFTIGQRIIAGLKEFSPKQKIHKTQKAAKIRFDWTTLKKGDLIKIKGGPYWTTDDGIKISMGYKGTFIVHVVDENGIHAYSDSGYAYIWMGQKMYSNGVTRRPHKILKVKRLNLNEKILNG